MCVCVCVWLGSLPSAPVGLAGLACHYYARCWVVKVLRWVDVCGATGSARAHVHLMKHHFRKSYDTRSDTEHEWWHCGRPEGGELSGRAGCHFVLRAAVSPWEARGYCVSPIMNEPNSNYTAG